jgi:hypothetical protein
VPSADRVAASARVFGGPLRPASAGIVVLQQLLYVSARNAMVDTSQIPAAVRAYAKFENKQCVCPADPAVRRNDRTLSTISVE